MKPLLSFLGLVILFTACTPEVSQPAYSGEKDSAVIKEFNQAVASSEAGFSKSYRASLTSYQEPDPLFYEAQNLIRYRNNAEWVELSEKVKPYVEKLAEKGRHAEVQLLCLMVIDKVLLPNLETTSVAEYGHQLDYFLETLVNNKGVDLDIMTKALLQLKNVIDPSKIDAYSSYLKDNAERDLAQAKEKLANLKNDEYSYSSVSRRYYEQVISEASFTLLKLDQMQRSRY